MLMSRVDARLLLIALVGTLRAFSALAHEHAEQMPMGARLGSVSFETSCQPQVQADFNRAVALLHSFWLDEAERTFMKVVIADPDCALAYWGIAMADFNEVNGGPTSEGIVRANQSLAKADSAREKDQREAAYIHAVHLFFDGYTGNDFDVYAKRYTQATEEVAARLLRPVADRQRQIGKGEVEWPAREMLAEMLLLSGKNGEALHGYQLSLVSDPNRFNALFGAGNAAEQLGRHKVAVEYYRTLLSNCAGATGAALKELERAQAMTK